MFICIARKANSIHFEKGKQSFANMGHGAAKHSRNYLVQDKTQFSDIATSQTDMASTSELTQEDNDDILAQINNAVHWPQRLSEQTTELKQLIRRLFESSTKEMTRLTEEMKYSQVEEIARALTRLTSLWDDEFVSYYNIKSFIREIITLEVKGIEYLVQAGEFCKREPFYENDERLVKLYYFHIKDSTTKSRIMSYYLECSNIIQPYFSLGLHVSGTHLGVESYDRTCPSYWIVREAVLRDMKSRINANKLIMNEKRQSMDDIREGVQV